MSALWAILALAAATLVSEDLTCITAGLLVARGELSLTVGVFGCLMGIFVGDTGLWLLGRVAWRRVQRWRWVRRRVTPDQITRAGQWFDRRAAAAVFAARFMPGLRLPTYLAAGALGRKAPRFLFWMSLAAAVWTPILVLLSAWLGESFAAPMRRFLGGGWIALLIVAAMLLVTFRVTQLWCTRIGRARLIAGVSGLWRYEFWPTWLFYLPLLPWIAFLSLRHRGLTTITAANPGIEHGGFVGESKSAILGRLPAGSVARFALIAPGDRATRRAGLRRAIEQTPLAFPLVLKPDAGQRGTGVSIVHSLEEADAYLERHHRAVIAQERHDGPYEAGVFYCRWPDQWRGFIFSITDKSFPVLLGDGKHTVEQLIWRHRRYRMQARVFLERHDAHRHRVLADGERMILGQVGNHCKGSLFRDGRHLLTPRLEAAIDAIAQRFDGFHFGRFDIRYRDPHALMDGRDLTIVELNGITSESTNIYDPRKSLWWAYATLAKQWSLLFRIGAMNRARGAATSSLADLYRAWREHHRDLAPTLADEIDSEGQPVVSQETRRRLLAHVAD